MSVPRDDHSTRILRQYTRRLLDELVQTDSDFNALCMDYFHPIEKRFSAGMDRTQKINILFELNNPKEIVYALAQFASQRFNEIAENILISMSPSQSEDSITKTDRIVRRLQNSDSDISNKKATISFADFEDRAKQLEKSLPVAAPSEKIDIFASVPPAPRPPVTLYRIPTGVYIAQMVVITHNSCDADLQKIKPGYQFNVKNDTSTGSFIISSLDQYILGMGAVRYNQGILTATYSIETRNETHRTKKNLTKTHINHYEHHLSTRTIKLHIVGDARLHLDFEDIRTEQEERSSKSQKSRSNCIVRFRLEAEQLSP